jgi:hypothetical protein
VLIDHLAPELDFLLPGLFPRIDNFPPLFCGPELPGSRLPVKSSLEPKSQSDTKQKKQYDA